MPRPPEPPGFEEPGRLLPPERPPDLPPDGRPPEARPEAGRPPDFEWDPERPEEFEPWRDPLEPFPDPLELERPPPEVDPVLRLPLDGCEPPLDVEWGGGRSDMALQARGGNR